MARQAVSKVTDDEETKKNVRNLKRTASNAASKGEEVGELAYDELLEQFNALKEDFAALSDSLAKAGKQSAEDVAEAARQTGRRAAAKANEGAEYAVDQVESTLQEAENFARKRPGTALGIAAGAGFLLALVMSRR